MNPNQLNPNNPLHQARTAAVMAGIPIGSDEIDPKSNDIRTYYSRYAGSKFYFSDGGTAVFFGGEYKIDAANPDNAIRVRDLEQACKAQQPIFSMSKVRLIKTDSKLLREVGSSMGGIDPEDNVPEQEQPRPNLGGGGVGLVNTAALNTSAQS